MHASFPLRERCEATGLPVLAVIDQIVDGVSSRPHVVIEAPPGAGKTTVVPLAVAGVVDGRVLVVEPRRVAARAAAERMAEVARWTVGDRIGWTTGDGSKTSPKTTVEVVTDGVLLRRLIADPTLDKVGAVIFDEFHERSVAADLSLAFTLETFAVLRPELRVVVMSATLDGARVASLLSDPVMVRSEGQSWPVETVNRRNATPQNRIAEDTADGILDVWNRTDGAVLAFVPGRREIDDTVAAVRSVRSFNGEVFALHGSMPLAQQRRVITETDRNRRVIVATNIAESSVTVPGVRAVVDSGWHRRPSFDPATGMSRMQTVRVSQASADQRRGRAGRTCPGLCVRLWPETTTLMPHSEPQITIDDVTGPALDIAAWGTDVTELALLDRPSSASWAVANETLRALGAVDDTGRITDLGRSINRVPTHPRLARMLLSVPTRRLDVASDIAALLSERDVPGVSGADIEARIEVLRRGGSDRRVQRVRDTASKLRRAASTGTSENEGTRSPHAAPTTVGAMIAAAFPDRVAVARSHRSQAASRGSFVLANGREASLPPGDSLAGERFLAVADVDRGDQIARIFRAAPLDKKTVNQLAITVDHVAWQNGDVVAERQRRIGYAVVSTAPLPDPSTDAITAAVLDGVAAERFTPLRWDQKLVDRLAHLHRIRPEAGWPPVDLETLIAEAGEWLAPFLVGVRRRKDLASVDVHAALLHRVPFHLQHTLNTAAPTHVTVPSGRTVRVEYSGERPTLAVKLQEMFGTTEAPTVAGEPITVSLLSPAGRPLQVTQDLSSFWNNAYTEVRKEMRGRYPKHPWPEDPLTATPTRHTNARLRRDGNE